MKVFGVPLPDVMARSCESGEVPRFVDELIRRCVVDRFLLIYTQANPVVLSERLRGVATGSRS